MNRKDAIHAGLITYFTGTPCKHGHVADRYVNNWTCVVCAAIRSANSAGNKAKWRAENKAYRWEKAKEYRALNSKAVADKHKRWREANPEKCAATQLIWQQSNREKVNAYSREWRNNNRHVMNDLKAKRRADTLARTPKWLSSDEKWMLREVYALAALRAKTTGLPWHVDHIIPLRGEKVSGLHTPYNLQVILAAANIQKGARYEPT
jgi:hypothetical protein